MNKTAILGRKPQDLACGAAVLPLSDGHAMSAPMPASARLEASSFTALRRAELIVLFGVLTVFTPFAVDMYMPAMPTIAREFHAPTAAIEHSLASYFLGLAVGQAV